VSLLRRENMSGDVLQLLQQSVEWAREDQERRIKSEKEDQDRKVKCEERKIRIKKDREIKEDEKRRIRIEEDNKIKEDKEPRIRMDKDREIKEDEERRIGIEEKHHERKLAHQINEELAQRCHEERMNLMLQDIELMKGFLRENGGKTRLMRENNDRERERIQNTTRE